MQQRKKIEIKKKESQLSYLDDIHPVLRDTREVQVRKSLLISKDLDEKIQTYIYQKRTKGDIYYTQTNLMRDALDSFFKTEK
jgi:hypothetical protein